MCLQLWIDAETCWLANPIGSCNTGYTTWAFLGPMTNDTMSPVLPVNEANWLEVSRNLGLSQYCHFVGFSYRIFVKGSSNGKNELISALFFQYVNFVKRLDFHHTIYMSKSKNELMPDHIVMNTCLFIWV